MEENQPKLGKFSWLYGLLGGATIIVFSLMLYMSDIKEQGMGVQLVGLVILIVAVILAIVQFKKANGGFISLKQALKLGAGVGLIVGLLVVLYSLLFTYVIDPELVAQMIEAKKQETLVQNPQMTDEQWETGLKIQQYVQYPAIIIIEIIIGLLAGLIIGAIVKNTRPE